MTAPSDVITWKYANLFHPDAGMSAGARRLFPLGSDNSVDWLRRKMGGLWVGGTVALTRDTLYFSPNSMNAAAHDRDTSAGVSLERVVDVTDRFGWVTRIIDVRTDTGELFTFRCFGARAFADTVRQAVASRRNASS